MKKKMIGIDIGGSTIKIGVLNEEGLILEKWEIKTRKENDGDNIVDDIWSSISSKLSANTIKSYVLGIGVGAPGFVDKELGLVYEAVNIGWKNFQLGKHLRMLSNLPVFIENDANLAALGENWIGSGNQVQNLIAVTLGTGVGSGIIVNGSVLSGYNGTAGEIGHIIQDPKGFQCNCGRVGCLDTIASARGIVNQAIDSIPNAPSSNLSNYLIEKKTITAKDIFELASSGDELCQNVIARTTNYLGYALASAATIINPSKILIGGGVSKAGNQLLFPVREAFQRYSLKRISEACEIEIAKLGNDAGIIGGGYLVKENITMKI